MPPFGTAGRVHLPSTVRSASSLILDCYKKQTTRRSYIESKLENAAIAVNSLEVRVVVQRKQPEKLREGFYLLRDALPCPQLGQHAHSHAEHGGPTTAIR